VSCLIRIAAMPKTRNTSRPVILHYHATAGVDKQEVCLCPETIVLREYARLTYLAVEVAPSPFPSSAALGQLPGAFVDGVAFGGSALLKVFQGCNDLDDKAKQAGQDISMVSPYAGFVAKEFGEITRALLLATSCFDDFTGPVIKRSSPWPLSWWFFRNAQQEARRIVRERTEEQFLLDLDAKVVSVLKNLQEQKENTGGDALFLFGPMPTTADLWLYANMKVICAATRHMREEEIPLPSLRNKLENEGYVAKFEDAVMRSVRDGPAQPIQVTLRAPDSGHSTKSRVESVPDDSVGLARDPTPELPPPKNLSERLSRWFCTQPPPGSMAPQEKSDVLGGVLFLTSAVVVFGIFRLAQGRSK